MNNNKGITMLNKLEGLGDPRLPYDNRNEVNGTMLEYRNIACKTISRYGGSFAQQMLADEDTVANIATQIMFGDWKWNPEKSSKQTYRINRARWAIKHHVSQMMKNKDNPKVYSIFRGPYKADGALPDTRNTIQEIDNKDMIESILSSNVLSTREKDFIYRSYIIQEPVKEIALGANVTRQRVDQIIKEGLNKLKRQYGNT